jgi:hypothetical protein
VLGPEVNSKHILLGYFGIAPYVHVLLENVNAPATLCFVFTGGAAPAGKYDFALSLIDPAGKELSNSQTSPPIHGGTVSAGVGSFNIFLAFQGVLGTEGIFQVSLMVDGLMKYRASLGIEQVKQPNLLQ